MLMHMILVQLSLVALTAVAQQGPTETLPTPVGLEGDVAFWEDVFTKYRAEDCVLHDKFDLQRVYLVKLVPRNLSPSARGRLIDKHESLVRGVLEYFARGGEPRNQNEAQILAAFSESERVPDIFNLAAENVRCQQGVSENLLVSMKRSRRYLPTIKAILRTKNLPEDLAYLPHLESGFDNLAKSKVGARGLWQLMPYTAREGLRVTRRKDERINPAAATDFATDMLQNNFRKVQSWPLALTGYNYGINGILRAVRNLGTTDYMVLRDQHRTKTFGFAARNFYASFLAVRNVVRKFESSTTRGPTTASATDNAALSAEKQL